VWKGLDEEEVGELAFEESLLGVPINAIARVTNEGIVPISIWQDSLRASEDVLSFYLVSASLAHEVVQAQALAAYLVPLEEVFISDSFSLHEVVDIHQLTINAEGQVLVKLLCTHLLVFPEYSLFLHDVVLLALLSLSLILERSSILLDPYLGNSGRIIGGC
jgi:hypothetical protein